MLIDNPQKPTPDNKITPVSPMKLSPDEVERYARHIVLREVGGPGQQKLKKARVLIVGAGGIGAPALQYLAAAGVGTLGIVDDDTVSLSNLQRQIIHSTADIGRLKVDSAKDAIERLNPHIVVAPHATRLQIESAPGLIAPYDIVLDGSDNFATRYALAEACAHLQRPLVSAAVGRFEGSLTLLKPFAKRPDGTSYPSYRDLFPEAPPEGTIPSCAEAGILGALTGVLGTYAAMEVLKEILCLGESLAGRLLLVDMLGMRIDEISY